MGRKKRKFESDIDPADKALSRLRYNDLKREVVIRGMDFEKVVEGDYYSLSGFFRANFYTQLNYKRLDEFDDWVEAQIKDKSLVHPSLRLGFIGERDDEGNVLKKKRIAGVRKKKEPAPKNEKFGVRVGTKKELTFKCQDDGIDLKDTIKTVMKQFPDAKEKSIIIWYKRAQRSAKNTH